MEKYSKEDLLGVLPTAIVNSKELTAKQKIVLAQLYMYDGLEKSKINGCSFRSNKDFCNDISIDKNTLITALRKLEEMKFISRNVGSRHSGASEYTILKDNINDWCKGEIHPIKIHPNETENSPYNSPYYRDEKIAELSDRIRVLEELVEKLMSEIHPNSTEIHPIKIHPNETENSPSDTDTDSETESDIEIDENKKKKILKEKKVETAKDFKLNFDDILLSEEDSINEQVEKGASMGIEASESPVTNNISSDEELYEQVMAKIKLSIDKFSSAHTEKDLDGYKGNAEKMVKFYSKENKTVSDKAMEYLSAEFGKHLERINSISRHQYVAGQGFKTLK